MQITRMADAIRVSSLQRANVCMRKESALSILMSFLFSYMDGLAGILTDLTKGTEANVKMQFVCDSLAVAASCSVDKHIASLYIYVGYFTASAQNVSSYCVGLARAIGSSIFQIAPILSGDYNGLHASRGSEFRPIKKENDQIIMANSFLQFSGLPATSRISFGVMWSTV